MEFTMGTKKELVEKIKQVTDGIEEIKNNLSQSTVELRHSLSELGRILGQVREQVKSLNQNGDI
jgi:hypothetical protein